MKYFESIYEKNRRKIYGSFLIGDGIVYRWRKWELSGVAARKKYILASGEWMNNHIGYGGVWKYYIIVNDICQRRKMHISEYVKFWEKIFKIGKP